MLMYCKQRRNYNDFVVFTTLSALDIILAAIGNICLIVLQGIRHANSLVADDSHSLESSSTAPQQQSTIGFLLTHYPDCFVVAIFLIGILIPVMMLLVLHISLICRGISTNERIKFVFHFTPSIRDIHYSFTYVCKQENLCKKA